MLYMSGDRSYGIRLYQNVSAVGPCVPVYDQQSIPPLSTFKLFVSGMDPTMHKFPGVMISA